MSQISTNLLIAEYHIWPFSSELVFRHPFSHIFLLKDNLLDKLSETIATSGQYILGRYGQTGTMTLTVDLLDADFGIDTKSIRIEHENNAIQIWGDINWFKTPSIPDPWIFSFRCTTITHNFGRPNYTIDRFLGWDLVQNPKLTLSHT